MSRSNSATLSLQPGSCSLDTYMEITLEFNQGNTLNNRKRVPGEGVGVDVLKKRRNSLAISKAINYKLVATNSKIQRDYKAALKCSDYVQQKGSAFHFFTCKKLSCILCSRIRAAKLFKQYAEPLLSLPDLYMVTLTAPTVEGGNLNEEIRNRYKIITRIKDSLRKEGVKMQGIRTLEAAHNKRTDLYHPHYHLIISGKEVAQAIVSSWLKRIPAANARAQKIEKMRDEGALREVFKYVTKQVISDEFNSHVLDTVYTSIKGVRIIQAFGIKAKGVKKKDDARVLEVKHKREKIDLWKWCNNRMDWYTAEGEQLNEGELKPKTKKLLDTINNLKNEKETPNSATSEQPTPRIRRRVGILPDYLTKQRKPFQRDWFEPCEHYTPDPAGTEQHLIQQYPKHSDYRLPNHLIAAHRKTVGQIVFE